MSVNILLAENNTNDALFLADMLVFEGDGEFFVEHVGTSTEAINRLKGGVFDILLLSLDLSDSKGMDTLSALIGRTPDTAVVVLTESDDGEMGYRAVCAGAQDCLVKSRINARALRRVVRYCLERFKAQTEHERLGRFHEHILKSVGEGVVGIDRNGVIAFINPMAANMLGRAPHELLGASLHEALCSVIEHYGDYADELVEGSNGGGSQLAKEWTFQRRDGSTFPVRGTWTALRENNQEAGMVLVFREITQQREHESALVDQKKQLEDLVEKRTRKLSNEIADRIRTEIALKESQNWMKAITRNLFECVLVVDGNGHIVFANHSAEVLLNTEDSLRLAGRDLDTVFALQNGRGKVDFLESTFHKVACEGTVFTDDDAVFITLDGKSLSVAYACSPLIENDKRLGAIISFRDIRKLKAAQHEAQQASKLACVGQLAGGIAHEINTPAQYIGDNLKFLTDAHKDLFLLVEKNLSLVEAVRGHEDLSAMAGDVDKLREEIDLDYLREEIPAATEQSLLGIGHVSKIVLAMKEFSHPGTKEMSLADINQALENTITISSNEWKHVAEVTTIFDESLPSVSCFVGEMNQVFLNLLVNAAHAIADKPGRSGLGRIKVSTEADSENVIIHIEDNGAGIPEESRDQIFTPFFTTKEVGQGTGQGLAIAWDIVVNKHGGTITFGTELGKSTTFTVKLPLRESPLSQDFLPPIDDGGGVSITEP